MSSPRRRILGLALVLLTVPALLAPQAAQAHGFGQRYDLPVPLWLYLYGAAAAVILSFAAVALFVGQGRAPDHYPRYNLLRLRPFRRVFGNAYFLGGVRLLSVALFFLTIVSGLFGQQASAFNFAPTFVWIVWWVGLSLCSALIGDLWPLVNPWAILFDRADAWARRAGGGLDGDAPYPARWGVWPALLLYCAFVWVEIVYEGAPTPANIAMLALAYSLVTWGGMLRYGKDAWLARGEAFTVFFGILARFAPTELRVTDRALCRECPAGCATADGCVNCAACFAWADPADRELNLRPWGVGLLRAEAAGFDRLAFVVFMLAGVTFDGLVVTSFWAQVQTIFYPHLGWLGRHAYFLVQTLGLLALPALFLALYLACCAAARRLGGRTPDPRPLAGAFIYALVPIALAYQLAHYLSYLLIQGQRLIPLLSDPLGLGWDLFGTAGYTVRVGIIDARTAWYVQVAAIVIGHVLAVYLAHVIALRRFPSSRRALRSQLPLLALMVLYTVSSLWILSQPTVSEERGTAPPVVSAAPSGSAQSAARLRIVAGLMSYHDGWR